LAKYHVVFQNKYTERIGFLCRAINLLEDVLEDAECADLKVALSGEVLIVEPVKCTYDIRESVELFRDQHNVETVVIGAGEKSYRELYDEVIATYVAGLHSMMLELSGKTRERGVEYYMGVLFSGQGFIVEGERDRVRVPGIAQCVAAHTHPTPHPIPSANDLKSITNLMLSRGIGHIIVGYSASLAIYRVSPLTERDLEILNEIQSREPAKALKALSSCRSIMLKLI